MKQIIQNWLSMLQARMMVFMDSTKEAVIIPEGELDRDSLIVELRALQQQDREEVAAHQLRLVNLGKELLPVEQRVAKLHREIELEHARRSAQSFERNARINKIHQALEDSCPVDIDMFLERVKDEVERCQRNFNPDRKATHRLIELRRIRGEAAALKTAPRPIEDVLREFGRLEHTMATIH